MRQTWIHKSTKRCILLIVFLYLEFLGFTARYITHHSEMAIEVAPTLNVGDEFQGLPHEVNDQQ